MIESGLFSTTDRKPWNEGVIANLPAYNFSHFGGFSRRNPSGLTDSPLRTLPADERVHGAAEAEKLLNDALLCSTERQVTKCGQYWLAAALPGDKLEYSQFFASTVGRTRRTLFSILVGIRERMGKGDCASCTPRPHVFNGSAGLPRTARHCFSLLFRAVVFRPTTPILIADNEGRYHDASVGAGRILGVPTDKIIGRRIDDFAQPAFKPNISGLWRSFLADGQQQGKLPLVRADGSVREVEYTAKRNVLPKHHVLVLRDKTPPAEDARPNEQGIPGWAQDYALYLVDIEGRIAAWYSGAVRIYGYPDEEALGQPVSILYPSDGALRLAGELERTAAEGHVGAEGWQAKKDGSRFWANTITMALKDERGELQGFARVVRDFSERHERDGKLHRHRARQRYGSAQLTIAGVASGEFDGSPRDE